MDYKATPRKLPVSSYEVIHLPTLTNKSPLRKGSYDLLPGAKRRKIMASVTSLADKFRSERKTKYSSFTKTLTKSHVSKCFLMGIPVSFCAMHLPSFDTSFLLENESGKVYKANYLAQSKVLSRGWREFCLAEKLSEGDVLVFKLVNPTKFKVRRIRKNSLSEVNGAHTTLFSYARVEQNDAATHEQNKETCQASSFETASGDKDHVVIRSADKNVQKVLPSVTSQADELQSKLVFQYPSFTKVLLKSHVSGGSWMGLPRAFCAMHLPSFDTIFILENETGKQYGANYLARKVAFSDGWREFCLAEKLSEGDTLIFKLVTPTKFKVSRIRNSCLNEVNLATLNPDASVEQSEAAIATHEQNKVTRLACSSVAASGDDDHVVIQSEDENVPKVMPSVSNEADGFRSNLEGNYPTFTKALLKSHVSGGFWMGLPQPFCRRHLPSVDTYFLLEYENGKQYEAKYLAPKAGLSGGWRGFSIAEKLTEGDILVFQLVNSTKFKVHKRSGLSDSNGDRVIPSAGARVELRDAATLEQDKETRLTSSSEPVSRDENHVMICSEDENVQKAETIKNSGDAEHVHFPPIIDDHNGFTNFDDFIILVDDFLKKDYNLPYHIKRSYYELCSSQKSVLHADLLRDMNPGMVAGCIIETVDIANAVRSCEFTTLDTNFSIWDRKLKSLELLGMNVKFLSARLLHLQGIAFNLEAAKNRQQYSDLCSERADCENIIKFLQDKLNDLKRLSEKHADDIEKLKTEITKHELRFQEQVSAPW